MTKRWFAKWSAAVLFGVIATAPALAAPDPDPAGRIGIVNLLEPEITNVHLGLTAFGNYNNRLANDWGLDRRAYGTARALLEKRGYAVVDVRLDGRQIDELRGNEDLTTLNYSGLTHGWTSTYREIIAANHIAALVVLRDQPQAAGREGLLPYHGYGILSSMGRKPKHPLLFTTAYADVIGGEPPRRLTRPCVVKGPQVPLYPSFDPNLVPIENFADIKIEDMTPLRQRLEDLVETKIHSSIGSSGYLGDQDLCPAPQR